MLSPYSFGRPYQPCHHFTFISGCHYEPQLDNPGKPLLYIQGRWLLIIGPQGLTMPCLAHLHPVVHGSKDSRAGGLLDTRSGDGMGSYRPEVKVLFRHLDEPIDT